MQTDRSGPGSPEACRKPSWRTRLPFFYGWVIVGSAFATHTISYGVYYTFTVFFVALLGEFGWGRAPTAGVFSVFMLVLGFSSIVSGSLSDRFGPSRVVPVGALLQALGLIACSRVAELWQFYLAYGVVCGFGVAMGGVAPCHGMLSRWFSRRRGVAMGIASAGIGLGIVALIPLSQYLISSFGWRTAYLILAGVSLFGLAPQAALLQVGRPELLGLKPDGIAAGEASSVSLRVGRVRELTVVDQKWASRVWSIATVTRTRRFWLLWAANALAVIGNQGLWIHQVAYLADSGYDKMLAASVAGLAGFLSMPYKIMWGAMGDRLGREVTFSAGMGAMMLAVFLLMLTGVVPGIGLVLLFAVTFAAGYAVSAPLTPVAAADIFEGPNFGAIYGVMSVSTGVGGAFGAWAAGYVFDTSGSYAVAFAAAACVSAGAAVCMWLAAPRKVRRVAGRRGGEVAG